MEEIGPCHVRTGGRDQLGICAEMGGGLALSSINEVLKKLLQPRLKGMPGCGYRNLRAKTKKDPNR